MKKLKTPALLLLAACLFLTGCSSKWSPGGNTISSDGVITFYNGVTINQPCQINEKQERESVVFDGRECVRSVYQCQTDTHTFSVMQISCEGAFSDVTATQTTEDFSANLQGFADGIAASFHASLPDAVISAPEVDVDEQTSQDGEVFKSSLWRYTISYSNVDFVVYIRLVVSNNDIISVTCFDSPGKTFASELMDKVTIA